MNNVIACVFPETLPAEGLLFPLVQVFGRLVYVQAVEDEPLVQDSPLIEHLLQEGILRLFAPVPLEGQRERFLALMDDMKKRKDDYMSQLSMLTLAGLNRRGRTESKGAILASLLQSGNIDSRKEEEELLLWQSRLMLKLGEFLDAEQAELNKAFQTIAARQDELLAELREETESPFSLTASLQDSDRETGNILSHRLKAWSRLFFHDASPLQPQVFVTAHEAAMDTLLEVFERQHRRSALEIVSLELLAPCHPLPPNVLAAIPPVQQCAGLQAALAMLLSDFASSPLADLKKNFTACAVDWSKHLASRYPTTQHGRCTLHLFLFPEISSRQLFLESFAGAGFPADDQGRSPGSGVVAGLLKRGGTSA